MLVITRWYIHHEQLLFHMLDDGSIDLSRTIHGRGVGFMGSSYGRLTNIQSLSYSMIRQKWVNLEFSGRCSISCKLSNTMEISTYQLLILKNHL